MSEPVLWEDPAVLEQILQRSIVASPEELYTGIGQELPEPERQARAQAAGLKLPSLKDIGRLYYEKVRPDIADAICVKAAYCENKALYERAAKLTAMVAEAVAGIVFGAAGGPGAVLSGAIAAGAAGLIVNLSAAVLKEGLNDLCECPDLA